MKTIFVLTLMSTLAFGAGFEKTILWGGKYSGVAGAAAAGVKGSDSVYYNPAGLALSSQTVDLTVSLTNISSQVKGPIVPTANILVPAVTATPTAFTNGGKQETGATTTSTIPGVTYSMMLSDSLALGLGYYGVAGVKALYEDVSFAPRNFKAKVASDLAVSEFAAGVGYKVNDSLRLGVAIRYTMATAAFSAVSITPHSLSSGQNAIITNLDVKDAKSAKIDSIRIGAQYDVNESTKIGLAIRTETKFDAEGKASGRANICIVGSEPSSTCPGTLTINEVDAKIKSVLPMAINLGVEHKLNESWNLFGEVVHTQYSTVDKVAVDGTITISTTSSEIPDIDQKWKDQLNVKLAGEYVGMSWPVRFGFIHTSQVSDASYARASFTPPSASATYTLGTGHVFNLDGSVMELNFGLDYTSLKGTGDASVQPLLTPNGDYEGTTTGIHTGLAYRF